MVNYADIAVILILLIFGLVGFSRGFMHSLTKLFGFFVILIIATILCESVCVVICKTTLDDKMLAFFANLFSNYGANTPPIVSGDSASLATALTAMNIPSFISGLIAPALIKIVPADLSASLHVLLAGLTVQTIMVIVVTILLMVVIKLTIMLIEVIVRLFKKDLIFNTADKILGAALGAVKGCFAVFGVLLFGNYFLNQSYAAVVKNQIQQGSISNIFYSNNVVVTAWEKYINFENIFGAVNGLLGKTEDESEAETDSETEDDDSTDSSSANNVNYILDNTYKLNFNNANFDNFTYAFS